MNSLATFAPSAYVRPQPRFVLVNDRTPRAPTRCAMCASTIATGYVREPRTRLMFCDALCFAGHAKMAALMSERRARRVS
jgi:hypothetical protein